MATVDTTQPQESTETQYVAFDSGTYRMKIVAAKVAPSIYENERTKEHDDMLTVTWQLCEPLKHPESPEVEFKDRVYHSIRYWYGEGASGPSMLKQFLDRLIAEKAISPRVYVADGDNADNQGDLIGIERDVMVSKHIIGKGPNKGKYGNKIVEVLPLNGQSTPAPIAPKPAVPAPPAIPRRTAVTTTNGTPAAPKVIPPAKYFDDMLAEADDPALPMEQLIEIDAEFRRYAGGFWTTKERASEPDELRNQLRRMLGMITRNRNEAQPEEDLAF
jgi:hypothetical protein